MDQPGVRAQASPIPPVHHALYPECARVLAARGRNPALAADPVVVLRRARGCPGNGARRRPQSDECRPGGRRRRAADAARAERRIGLDTPVAGFLLIGFGMGLLNPAIASTAIGVVPASRSGMASGINNTFRQGGIATGVAGLGAVFQSQIASHLNDLLPNAPTGFDELVAAGGTRAAGDISPPQFRAQGGDAATNAFVASFNDILLIGAIVLFAGAVLTFALVRRSDFVDTPSDEPGSGKPSPSPPRPESVQAGP